MQRSSPAATSSSGNPAYTNVNVCMITYDYNNIIIILYSHILLSYAHPFSIDQSVASAAVVLISSFQQLSVEVHLFQRLLQMRPPGECDRYVQKLLLSLTDVATHLAGNLKELTNI